MDDADTVHERLRRAADRPGRPSSDYDLNPEIALPEGRRLREAAVLIAVMAGETGPQVLLTKRSSRLKHHPGQVAFPGGKVDDGDDGAAGCALREAQEEVGLPSARVRIAGALPPHETVTSFNVTPVLATLGGPFDPVPEPGEVDEVFFVPLAHVVDPAQFSVERRRWRGVWRHYYAVPYGPYYIWGATARILRALADRMAP